VEAAERGLQEAKMYPRLADGERRKG
jgi:hypothetical protein